MTSIDRHQLAVISIVGSFFDVTGALYLAYDILGGRHGPLRTLTRGVTYGILFGVGYGIPLGLPFGVAAGIAHGITLAFELSRASRLDERYPLWVEAIFSAIRGLGFGVGAAFLYGPLFGAVFGALSTLGQTIAYARGISPAAGYTSQRAPRITARQIWAGVVRTVGYATAGYASALIAHHQMHAVVFGFNAGLTIGVVTLTINFLMPYIEWLTNNMPERRMGVIGVSLILVGFATQSIQYWLTLFDVPVR